MAELPTGMCRTLFSAAAITPLGGLSSVILLERGVTAVAGQAQLRNFLPELRLVFRAARVECIFGGGLGFFVEKIELLPNVRVSKSGRCGIVLSTWSPGVSRWREEERERS